jgi:quinol monooxygenase YgiN
MVRLAVTIRASARRAQDLLEAFRFVIRGTQVDEGCMGCSAWVDSDLTVHYVEEWATEADVRARVRSDGFTSLLSVLESSEAPPSVQFDFVSATRGLDYVAEVRGEKG